MASPSRTTWRDISRGETWRRITRPKIRGVRRMVKLVARTTAKINQPEPKKPIISNTPWALIKWHGWAILSVAVSMTLIHLNLTEYTIGREVGANQAGTANILGALQLSIKAHELCIVASLYLIARQWIQGCLMDVKIGTVLGLVGAERSLGAPSFLVSGEFLTAARTGLSGNWRVCALAVYLFAACVISSLAGPASGALMIPRVDWFFEKQLTYLDMPNDHYPNILIDPRLGQGQFNLVDDHTIFDEDVIRSTTSGLDYWEQFYIQQAALGVVRVENTVHEFTDLAGRRYTNSSTTWGRPLNGDWNGGTRVSTSMGVGINQIRNALSYERSQNPHDKRREPSTESSTYVADLASWSGRKYVTKAMGIESRVQCRQKRKQRCTGIFSSTSSWCYLGGTGDDSIAPLRSSQDLLLMDGVGTGVTSSRVYMVEGPSLPNEYYKFRASFEVLIDLGPEPPYLSNFDNQTDTYDELEPGNITICALSTTLRPTVVSSLQIPFSPEYARYVSQSTNENDGSRTLIYHEHYLDYIHLWQPTPANDGITKIIIPSKNFTYPPWNMSRPSTNPSLTRFAQIFLAGNSRSEKEAQRNLRLGQLEAAALEIIVGGAFLHLIALINPTNSQYSVGPALTLPHSLMPEPRLTFPDTTTYVLNVYNQGYGFRLSSRTGLLGMIVLIAHAIIAVLGSLWLVVWERKVISAWITIPDYLALGIGSSIPGRALDNTCAGISGSETLGTFVVVGETTPQHLEITVADSATGSRPLSVLTRNRYGEKYGQQDSTSRGTDKPL